ncbi:MAG: lysine--tRNA ligase [Patescibacteria group bacterium]
MASLAELRTERLRKLALWREHGAEAYPVSAQQDFSLTQVLSDFTKLSKRKKALTVAGRVRAIRGQGSILFLDLDDGTEKLQLVAKSDEMDAKLFELFRDVIDVGDFIEASGSLFITKREEKSLAVKTWRLLGKSLRPLPDKWHGLQDVEERFRRRYLDIMMSPPVRTKLETRSRLITAIRKFFNQHGYLEVETPILQALAGGATARPFVTHHEALDTDFNLRIAQELYLKKLLVGGLNRVYEIGRIFRNEGIDTTHNPEFTMLESQEAYADATSQREFVEKLFKYLVKAIFGTDTLEYNNEKINFAPKFSVVGFFDLLKRYALIPDPANATRRELELKASQLGVAVEPSEATEKIMDNIYKKVCRPKLLQPTFIIDYPVGFNPFAKRKADDPRFIDRFQLVIVGLEMVNAFSELNDPVEQAERYREQDQKREGGEGEISPSDQDYLEAMEYGMPPNGGIGIGIDRLAMLFTDTSNIKEVIFFPTLKPKNEK